MNPDQLTVVHNEAMSRYEAKVDGGLAVVDYVRAGDVLDFTHTEVPEANRGKGIGGHIVRRAMEDARRRSLFVRPRCWFVRVWVRDHPEFEDLSPPDNERG